MLHFRPACLARAEVCCIPTAADAADEAEDSEEEWEEAGDSEEDEDSKQQPAMGARVPCCCCRRCYCQGAVCRELSVGNPSAAQAGTPRFTSAI